MNFTQYSLKWRQRSAWLSFTQAPQSLHIHSPAPVSYALSLKHHDLNPFIYALPLLPSTPVSQPIPCQLAQSTLSPSLSSLLQHTLVFWTSLLMAAALSVPAPFTEQTTCLALCASSLILIASNYQKVSKLILGMANWRPVIWKSAKLFQNRKSSSYSA